MSDEGDVNALLDERPDLRDALDTVLDVDEQHETWTFEDVPIGSGPFGELVSSGVVESVDDEYRLADPDVTAAALSDDPADEKESLDFDGTLSGFAWPTFDRTTTLALTAALTVVALVRAHPLQSVYRDGNVVLSGNDPYYYRYWVERVLADSQSVFSLDALAALPAGVTKGEPLLVATLWWVSELLGGGAAVVGDVMAWYPVLTAVITALFVYLLAVTVTGDRRVGLAAVLLFAIIPGHAMRTSLGFADHHAFDYPWLAATAYALTVLAGTDRDKLTSPKTWLASVVLGVAVAGQTLAWESAPLLIAAVGLAVAAVALTTVDRSESPLVPGAPILTGLTIATGLAAAGHVVVGWHTPRVAFSPALVLGGVALALLVGEAVHRATGDARHLLAIDAVLAPVGILAFREARPDDWDALLEGTGRITAERNIAETVGLFDPDTLGVLLLLGFTLVIAIPAMVAGIQRARTAPKWAVPTAYVWYFFALSTLSVRFVGELAPVLAVFAGIGFVRLAAWIDAVEALSVDATREALPALTVPDRRTLGTLALIFLLVGSLGIVQVPVKTGQLTVEDSTYQSAAHVANHSAQLDESYPDNYVLSQWGRNRVYNYFVNGESESYSYARQTYVEFLGSPNADEWYSRFDDRVGYVVLSEDINTTGGTAYAHLTDHYGSRTADRDGVAHFQPLYVTAGGEKITYQVVPGANLTGQVAPNETVAVQTNVTIPGASFTYERQTTADAAGAYSVRVANPGTYTIETANETREATVQAGAVRNGTAVQG
ncbi:STT3 domain-containing protein [Halomicrobium sp. LC1Hm]|uniref:STT3 domain-containing protein n=1 Tax=Halomicrobium sp. LC1Hm TaxID=2610902 RepID=UPI0012984D47|nr:STT3 domain-containing protein [Halomicrobium sp. LC1Hm]QGA81901.1 Dolichol phosphate-mannose mannosyltransferase [Halomicrobium sp. LC1Hm]